MTPRRILRRAPLLQAVAWALLALLGAGYLRVLVVCTGPCCEAHVELAFASKSCCEKQADGGCCDRPPSFALGDSQSRQEAEPARRSCCRGGAEHAQRAPAPARDASQEHREPHESVPAGSCCMSAPLDFEIGPLPGTVEWKLATELVACAPIAARHLSALPWPSAERRHARFSGAEDPPPLAHLRELLSTTLLRI